MFNFVKIRAKISKFRTMTNKHDIMWFDSLDSTNDEAARHIYDIDNLSVLSALEQSKGRGQKGNSWLSVPGINLTFSVVLKYAQTLPESLKSGLLMPLKATDQFAVSEAAALSVVDLLSEFGIQAEIKWPNDIYVDGKKICGILIEHAVRGGNLAHSIVGIGLNVNQSEFDPTLPNPTSMILCRADHDGSESFDTRLCLENFMTIFSGYVGRFLHSNGGLRHLRRMYLNQMWGKDKVMEFIDNKSGTRFQGIIRGLSDVGLLKVENEKGELIEFAFKEISYIL